MTYVTLLMVLLWVIPAWAVTPGPITSIIISDVGLTSATIKATSSDGSKVDVRLMMEPMQWGDATPLDCSDEGLCLVTGLWPNTRYAVQGIPYVGVMRRGAEYGPFSAVATFTTKAMP